MNAVEFNAVRDYINKRNKKIQDLIEEIDKRIEYLREQNKNNDNDMAYGGYRELEQFVNRLEELLK